MSYNFKSIKAYLSTLCFVFLRKKLFSLNRIKREKSFYFFHSIYFIENHKEELTEKLMQFYRKYKTEDNLLLQEQFCDGIKACEGVKRPVKESEVSIVFILKMP